jgi:hypothetical protein
MATHRSIQANMWAPPTWRFSGQFKLSPCLRGRAACQFALLLSLVVRQPRNRIVDLWKFYDITHREHVVCNPTSEKKLGRLVIRRAGVSKPTFRRLNYIERTPPERPV